MIRLKSIASHLTLLFVFLSCFGFLFMLTSGGLFTGIRSADENRAGSAKLLEGDTFHDLGTVIADRKTINHNFYITNNYENSVRITSARAITPCCSSVESVPRMILPGKTGKFAVKMSLSSVLGTKKVSFLIGTDHQDQPEINLTLSVNCLPAIECVETSGQSDTTRIGRSTERSAKIVVRHRGEEGRTLPTQIIATSPLTATFTAPPVPSLRIKMAS